MRIEVARAQLVQTALSYQATMLWCDLHPDDPGWDVEVHEEQLDAAVQDYAKALAEKAN